MAEGEAGGMTNPAAGAPPLAAHSSPQVACPFPFPSVPLTPLFESVLSRISGDKARSRWVTDICARTHADSRAFSQHRFHLQVVPVCVKRCGKIAKSVENRRMLCVISFVSSKVSSFQTVDASLFLGFFGFSRKCDIDNCIDCLKTCGLECHS